MLFRSVNRDPQSRALIAAGFVGAGNTWYDGQAGFRRMDRSEALVILFWRGLELLRRVASRASEKLRRGLDAVRSAVGKLRRVLVMFLDRATGRASSRALAAYRAAGEPGGPTDAAMWSWIRSKAEEMLAGDGLRLARASIAVCDAWRRRRGWRCYPAT